MDFSKIDPEITNVDPMKSFLTERDNPLKSQRVFNVTTNNDLGKTSFADKSMFAAQMNTM